MDSFHIFTLIFYQMVLYFYVICIMIYHVSCWTIVTMFMNFAVYGRTSCKTVPGCIILVKYSNNSKNRNNVKKKTNFFTMYNNVMEGFFN